MTESIEEEVKEDSEDSIDNTLMKQALELYVSGKSYHQCDKLTGINYRKIHREAKARGLSRANIFTPRMEKFSQSLASGMNKTDAYRTAYSYENKTQSTLNNCAYVLSKHPEVIMRVEEIRAPIVAKVGITLENHLARLRELSKAAEMAENYGPAVTAEVARGKVSGLYVENINLNGNVTIVASRLDEKL